MSTRVLLTGATGFVGSRLYPALISAGFDVRCSSRDPTAARARLPDREWVRLDVEDARTMPDALADVDVVVYLVHSIATHTDYAQIEHESAVALRAAAAAAGCRHVVYLGGVEPEGPPSHHLRSRLNTGETLRGGDVPTTELRAGMIVGHGSESWQICRDLARLPAMVLPQWLKTRSQPVAIDDVVAAVAFAVGQPTDTSRICDLPGPEVMSAREILERIAGAKGCHPLMVEVPFLTPRLSSYWLRFTTRADYGIARELIAGLTSDLIARHPVLWEQMEQFELTPFEQAMARAEREALT